MNTRTLTLKDTALWNEYINRLPSDQQDVYFTPEYYSLYENYGDGDALCFVFEHEDDIILYPFLKNSINALGYELDQEYFDIQGAYGYNGIVSSTKDKKVLELFWNEFDKYCTDNNIVAEFSRFHPLLKNQGLASNNTKVIEDRLTIAVDLSLSEEDIWLKQIESSNRKNIKKAIKNNLVFEADYEFKYINEFVDIYRSTMDKLSSIDYLYFNDKYFTDFVSAFKGQAFLGIIKLEDKVISAAMFMYQGKYGHYHLSGSNREYLKLYPNNLHLYGAMKELKLKGIESFHLGGGTTSNSEDSLYKFKSGFGKIINQFLIGKTIHNQNIYNQIVEQWKTKHPQSYEQNKIKLLGYRDLM